MEDKLILISPIHLKLETDGHGEFPDKYSVTKNGIEVIKQYFKNKSEWKQEKK